MFPFDIKAETPAPPQDYSTAQGNVKP